jgi:hypothetical protein
MNPGLNTTPGLGLPQPAPDMGQAPFGYTPQPMQSSPMAPLVPAAGPLSPTATPGPAQLAPYQPQLQPTMPVNPAAAPTQPHSVPQGESTDDGAIDQEWVSKAQEIVQRTHTDPYLQSVELNKIKAQYIRVRYNKDMKVSEEN